MTEKIDISHGLMRVLLNGTAGNVKLQSEGTRSLVQAIHSAALRTGGRWQLEMSAADLGVVHSIILTWAPTAPPEQVSRYTNWMCRQSVVYERLHAEHQAKKAS